MMDAQKIFEQYNYPFPQNLIAQKPAHPRDSARLLFYSRKSGKVVFDTFKNIGTYLPPGSVLIFNETKVIPARIELRKETGGRAQILFLAQENGLVKVMADRKLNLASRLYKNKKAVFVVDAQEKQFYFLKPLFPARHIFRFFEHYGVAPLPPYIKHSPLSAARLRREYQTVFAKYRGSVAAPTASLHFTKSLIAKLKRQGFQIKFLTLHVNLGTFAPLTKEQLERGALHQEYYEIPQTTIRAIRLAQKLKKPIIAIGTTSARALESAFGSHPIRTQGMTDLFIREGYHWNIVTGLVTNFHVPQSSLLMLVAAFTGQHTAMKLYKNAIQRRFRLFSFGDGMLIT